MKHIFCELYYSYCFSYMLMYITDVTFLNRISKNPKNLILILLNYLMESIGLISLKEKIEYHSAFSVHNLQRNFYHNIKSG